MWKRDEGVRPPQPMTGSTSTPSGAVPPAQPQPPAPRPEVGRQQERDVVNIGKSVIIKGELSGSEDLTIEGQVEGKIELRQNLLTIGPNAKIKAQVFAKTVVVEGHVHGNISAGERIDIRDKGVVEGNLAAPRVHRQALQTGEIGKLFQGLTIVESVLLQNKTRESLFRKG